jgi:hypothetical protein
MSLDRQIEVKDREGHRCAAQREAFNTLPKAMAPSD